MAGLRIAPGLKLDPDYVGGGTFALLAKKGAGKSYQARVMAEEFWEAGIPFVLLDPMGTSWGLRSSADGEGEGLPVAIFGGDHGDAPLERGAGQLLADLVVDEGLSMILDLSGLGSRAGERQFAGDFLERLYRRNSDLVHVLIDEADLFAPQNPQAGDRPLLGVTENIVRRGRNRGIGITLITQRPAVLNKDVLTQVDGLVAMRIVGLTDRKAIDEWVKGHGDVEAAAQVKGTLSGLDNGECWWWVPELDILKRVQVRQSRTFDSSPTKTRSKGRREPKAYADVDMEAIEARMAATIERAKAEDPRELQKRIRDLQREIAERPDPEPERIEVPVLDDEARGELRDIVGRISAMVEDLAGVARTIDARLGKAAPPLEGSRERQTSPPRRPPTKAAAEKPLPEGGGEPGPVSSSQSRILNALAALEHIGVRQPTKVQLALFSQASPKSSGYTNNLGALRSGGFLDYPLPGRVALTEQGRGVAYAPDAPSTVSELHAYVARLVGSSRWRLLEQLIDAYPGSLTKQELADAAGVSARSSGYTNSLGSLRSLGLLDYPTPGQVAACAVLFLEGAVSR